MRTFHPAEKSFAATTFSFLALQFDLALEYRSGRGANLTAANAHMLRAYISRDGGILPQSLRTIPWHQPVHTLSEQRRRSASVHTDCGRGKKQAAQKVCTMRDNSVRQAERHGKIWSLIRLKAKQ
jgi:hypothetical protein